MMDGADCDSCALVQVDRHPCARTGGHLIGAAEEAPRTDRQPVLPLDDATTRVLPIQLRVGDVVLDRNGDDWEVVTRPVGMAKKQVIARVRVPGRPETDKEQRWEVYERVTIRSRGVS
jgi:hypothetical protein